MPKLFRLLVTLAASLALLAGVAMAGPTNNDGDPDIPHASKPQKLHEIKQAPQTSQVQASGTESATFDVDRENAVWVKLLRAYFRLMQAYRF